jgi:hypothetical protein
MDLPMPTDRILTPAGHGRPQPRHMNWRIDIPLFLMVSAFSNPWHFQQRLTCGGCDCMRVLPFQGVTFGCALDCAPWDMELKSLLRGISEGKKYRCGEFFVLRKVVGRVGVEPTAR